MKYPLPTVVIPQEKRAEINQKIIHIIDAGTDCGITKADIFQAYTGDGGLHGLQFSDFNSFHQYTEAKKEIECGQFFTPHSLCQFLVDCIRPSQDDLIADLTCGMGNFFNYLPNESNVYGNEIDLKAFKVAKHLYPNAHLECQDIRHYEPSERFDIIFGNPPFNLKWSYKGTEYLSQLFYCMKAAALLRPAGLLALIVPSTFLADDFMDSGMIREVNERFSFIIQFDLPPTAFRQFGVSHFDTKVMVFQKRSEHIPHVPYSTEKTETVSITEDGARHVYENYLAPVMERKDRVKHKLFFERIHANSADREFAYTVKKLLFDIKRNPKTSEKHAKAMEYVNQYYTQERPESVTWEQWEQRKITKAKVLSQLRRIVRNQHHIEEDRIALVKTKYGVRLKAYSAKTKRQLSKVAGLKSASFTQMIVEEQYPFEDTTYKALFERKLAEYKVQNENLKTMGRNAAIDSYLATFELYDSKEQKTLLLNPVQKTDLGIALQKRYGELSWQQGSGKTLGGIAWYRFLLQTKKVRNVFVLSAALSINMTWKVRLKRYGENFITVKTLSDLQSVQPGQVVLLTFNMAVKYQRHIQKFIRMQSQKVALIVDEADELSNPTSKRTRATLACFRRVKYKLLTTGTTTRNNINELFPQLELLYNNSVNMLCECPTVFNVNKDGDIEEEDNAYYMEPFPAYHGQSLFKRCFCPAKVTVFGIRKHNQDIYNRNALESMIEKTIITRKFEEIAGEKKFSIVSSRIEQNEEERAVYLKIMREFHMMLHYFRSTGNSRKDSLLRLIRQIQLMIKSTSCPHKFAEYGSNELPSKFKHIVSLVGGMNEKVAIGTVFLETAEEYRRVLSKAFPNRPVFLVKGDILFGRRSDIIESFENTTNGILISTQQSLKSSVNIPSCNKVIIESSQWNIPKMEQYYFRFIRYDSEQHTKVFFVTYNDTIEMNLLALLMSKQRINDFIKTLDFKAESDIFYEYGIDLDVLDSIIEKELDEQGNVRLTWGHQKLV